MLGAERPLVVEACPSITSIPSNIPSSLGPFRSGVVSIIERSNRMPVFLANQPLFLALRRSGKSSRSTSCDSLMLTTARVMIEQKGDEDVVAEQCEAVGSGTVPCWSRVGPVLVALPWSPVVQSTE